MKVKVLIGMFFAATSFAASAAGTVLLDQLPPTYPYSGTNGPLTDYELGVSFNASGSFRKIEAEFLVNASGTSGPGTYISNLYTTSGTGPATIVATSSNTNAVATGTSVVTFLLESPTALTSGTYWATIKTAVPGATLGSVTSGSALAPFAFKQPLSTSFTLTPYPAAVRISNVTPVDSYPAKNGTFASNPSIAYQTLYPPAVNGNGDLAYRATLIGLFVNSSNNMAVFRFGNATEIVARKGSVAPDVSGTFVSFGDPVINNAGDMAFTATLGTNLAVTGSSNQGLWTDLGSQSLRLAWREGNSAPGLTGFKFQSLKWMHLCDNVLYIGASASGTTTRSGVWMYSGTTMSKVVAQGDSILLGGSNRVVSTVMSPAGVGTGNAQSRAATPGDTLVLEIKTKDGHNAFVPYGP